MKRQSLCTILLAVVAMIVASTVQAQSVQSGDHYNYQTAGFNFFRSKSNHKPSRVAFRLMPAGTYSNAAHSRFSFAAAANPVTGSGFAGRLAKWSGVLGTNTFVLGNSAITEDKFGKVGIGTSDPTSPLTVAGMIESQGAGGGIKFPDGTIQTTAGLASVFHDASLMGNGTQPMPLGIAPGGVQTIHLATGAVTGAKIANGSVVRSLNGLFDNVSLAAGSNITITPLADTLTIAATGLLSSINHDSTLTGNGTTGSPLGITVPLILNNSETAAIIATNTGSSSAPLASFSSGLVGITGSPGGSGVLGISGLAGFVGCGGAGVCGSSIGRIGVVGISGTSVGVFGSSTSGLAGEFDGNVSVSGMLTKGGGSFKIDHPLDPENKYLYHSFVESPDMKNIYDGNIVTDANGEATVELPAYFEALNRDFRYQLTVVGTFAQAIVAEKIKGNRFLIRTNAPNVEVSWQVTGIRQDGWANKNRIQVEVKKTDRERGHYLHPQAFDQPEELSIVWARNPELMKQREEARERAKQKNQ